MNREPTTLLIDADDTLWENNIYFENVATRFFTRLVAAGVDLARAEQALWETEQRNVKITGYGSSAFCRSLHETASALGVASLEPWIQEQEDWIFHHPIELMPGGADTLPRLAAGNRGQLRLHGRVVGRVVQPDVSEIVVALLSRVLARSALVDGKGDGALGARVGFSGVDEAGIKGGHR